MHILIADISHAYATQTLIFERDFNEMSKILITLIILFIFVEHVFIFTSQFSFVVKTIKVIPGRKVRSTHPVYIASCRGRKRSLSDNFKCRTHALVPYVPRFYDQVGLSSLREGREGGKREGEGEYSRGDVLGHVPREILSDIYAKVPTNVCSWMDPPSGGGDVGVASRLLPHESAEFFGKKPPCGTSLSLALSEENPVATKPPLSSLPARDLRDAILD